MCEPELSRGINGPLGILRLAVIRLDASSKLGQCADLLIGEAGFITAGAFLAAQRASSCGSPDDDALISKPALDNLTCRGIHHKVIGVGRAGDDSFSQAGISVDDCLTPLACHWIGCEEYARHRGFDHALHHNGQLDAALIEAQALPIAHRPISPQ